MRTKKKEKYAIKKHEFFVFFVNKNSYNKRWIVNIVIL